MKRLVGGVYGPVFLTGFVGWRLWAQLLLAIVIADAGITLMHYASHRIGPLWRLHAVHHSVQRLYGFNGLMKHPLHQLLEATAGLLPLLLMGIALEVAKLLALAIAVQLLLQHSNVDMRLGPLRWVLTARPSRLTVTGPVGQSIS